MQPLVGQLSDSSKSKFGRRRPFMISGAIIASIACLIIGYTREIAQIVTSEHADVLQKWIAVFSFYLLDFSINAGK